MPVTFVEGTSNGRRENVRRIKQQDTIARRRAFEEDLFVLVEVPLVFPRASKTTFNVSYFTLCARHREKPGRNHNGWRSMESGGRPASRIDRNSARLFAGGVGGKIKGGPRLFVFCRRMTKASYESLLAR